MVWLEWCGMVRMEEGMMLVTGPDGKLREQVEEPSGAGSGGKKNYKMENRFSVARSCGIWKRDGETWRIEKRAKDSGDAT